MIGQKFIIIYKLYIPRGSHELVYSSTGKRKYTIVYEPLSILAYILFFYS